MDDGMEEYVGRSPEGGAYELEKDKEDEEEEDRDDFFGDRGSTAICLDDSSSDGEDGSDARDGGFEDDLSGDGLVDVGDDGGKENPDSGKGREGTKSGGAPAQPVWLDQAHHGLESMKRRQLLDGVEKNLRYSAEAVNKDGAYFPYEIFTQALLAGFVRLASPSRAQICCSAICDKPTGTEMGFALRTFPGRPIILREICAPGRRCSLCTARDSSRKAATVSASWSFRFRQTL